MNRPARRPSVEAGLLGDVGDDDRRRRRRTASRVWRRRPTWQAPAQNRRRETDVFVSDIALILVRAAGAARGPGGQYRGHAQMTRFFGISRPWRIPADHRLGRRTGDFVSANWRAQFLSAGAAGIDIEREATRDASRRRALLGWPRSSARAASPLRRQSTFAMACQVRSSSRRTSIR